VLIYRGVPVGDIERELADHGWGGAWTDGVFDFHHFHSTSHEVLAVVAGSATLELGGPQGETFEVGVGAVLVLPAGTGHRRAAARDGFTVVGAYPPARSAMTSCGRPTTPRASASARSRCPTRTRSAATGSGAGE
jgi:uncharacterized protein YjlB